MYSMIYNVVLNSYLRAAGSTVNDAAYNFDWSVLPEGKYKLTWVFIGGPCDMTPLAVLPMLEIGLGQSSVFRVDPNNVRACSTNCVGILTPNVLADACYLFADLTTNPPIALASRPGSNTFSARLVTNDAVPLLFLDANGAMLPEYVLTLSLELVE